MFRGKTALALLAGLHFTLWTLHSTNYTEYRVLCTRTGTSSPTSRDRYFTSVIPANSRHSVRYPPPKEPSRHQSHWGNQQSKTSGVTSEHPPGPCRLCSTSHSHNRPSPITLDLSSHSSRLAKIHSASQDARFCILRQPLLPC